MEDPEELSRQMIERAKGAKPPKKLNYTHDAMIDLNIAEPMLSQGQLAARFGYSQAWVSTIMSSDAFQSQLAVRRAELIDPAITMSYEERIKALQNRSLEVMQEKLSRPSDEISDDLALKAAKLGVEYHAANKGLLTGGGPSQTERLEALASRLTGLIHHQRGEVQDVQAIESNRVSPVNQGQHQADQ